MTSTTNIPETVGGILRLSDAIHRNPGAGVAIYNRVSSRSQAGEKNVFLEERTKQLMETIRSAVPRGTVKKVGIYGVEEGKLSRPRPKLEEAVRWARQWSNRTSRPVIVVTSVLSRWLRAESYHRKENRFAWPTEEEFAQLRYRTGDVILATFYDPLLREDDQNRFLQSLGRKGGRKVELTRAEENEILFRHQRGESIRHIARVMGLPKGRVERFLKRFAGKDLTDESVSYATKSPFPLSHVLPHETRIYTVPFP